MNPSERGESDHAHPSPPAARGRPSLERPSLFAGMDGQPATAPSAPSVRILSTLESQQRPRPRRRVGEGQTAVPREPRPRRTVLGRLLLWSLLGAGLALTLGGLWLSAEQVQATASTHEVARTPAPAITSTRVVPSVAAVPASSAAVGASAVADTPLAALIENTAPTAAPPPSQDSPLKTLQEAPASPTVIQVASVPLAAVSPPAPKVTRTEPPAKPKPQAEARRPRQSADNDVALLQAMFEHSSRTPTTTRSAGQELARQCGPLSGDDARACRTRVCRQFPQAKVCR